MLTNNTDTKFLSSTKKFAVCFFSNPLRASRVPVGLYAVSLAVDSANGYETEVLSNRAATLKISEIQAQKLVASAVDNGLVTREVAHES